MSTNKVYRGELWWANLDPSVGDEPGKKRPVLVLQTNYLIEIGYTTVLSVSLTSQNRKRDQLPFSVFFPKGYANLRENSWVLCDQLRSLAIERFDSKIGGPIEDYKINEVVEKIVLVMGYQKQGYQKQETID
jgi:mRNA interferase MazF